MSHDFSFYLFKVLLVAHITHIIKLDCAATRCNHLIICVWGSGKWPTAPGTGRFWSQGRHQAHFEDILWAHKPTSQQGRETSVGVMFRSECHYHSQTTRDSQTDK